MPTPDRLSTIDRQERARVMHLEGHSWDDIADQLGYRGRSGAYQAALAAIRREPTARKEVVIAEEEQRLQLLMAEAWRIARRRHFVVAPGRAEVLCHPETGEPLDDDGVRLEALKFLLACSQSRRKLHGADAPARKVVEVVTEDVVDAEIRRLESELAGLAAAEGDGGAGR